MADSPRTTPAFGAPAQSTTVVVTTQPQAATSVHHSPHPCTIVCQFCHATVTTTTTYTVGTYAFIVCCILWLVGLGWGCCLIPFFMNECKDVVHTCPNCHATIGRWSKSR